MQAAPPAAPVTTLKVRAALGERFAATPAAKSAAAFYVPNDSAPEPTEGDTPLEEAWFKDCPDIIEGIKRGLADMAAGRVCYLGSFSEYADLELDEDES